MVRTWFENMRLIVAATDLSIPAVHDHLSGDPASHGLDDETRAAVAAGASGLITIRSGSRRLKIRASGIRRCFFK